MIKHLIGASILTLLPVLAAAESHGGMDGDAKKGERVFRKCQACHAVGEDAKNKVGPVLNGVVGRPVASVEDFAYSDTLKEMGAEGKTWTPEDLAAFLEKPRDYAKGTKMAFAGLRKEEERADVIAFLMTHKMGE
ncbi:c-type cytochrome [Sagittula stellata]|uniref:Cytochrome c family protein n=1 Tax=Sagittula stellata (strain ATCC 700073 / DSM 11524 / E-37) TaxID=388399 RepID=A3KAU5_SAGS3|nr:cytochrome c family protein [Sagittula stellata]EBA05673.1 cytochrome c family protein [Sagittula stellata E-37]